MNYQEPKKDAFSTDIAAGGSLSASTSSPPPPLGRNRIGRYEIIYPISRGGMACVYAGRLSGIAGFQRLVAIKVVHSHLVAEENFIEMFLDEARLAAEIHHPNVGEVLEVGEDNGLYYMVGELILGQSLRALFRRADKFEVSVPPHVIARIASKVCQGLHAAHELRSFDGKHMGLVHRDVSPRNILLSYDGFVKLIDFGIAYAEDRMSHTDVGTLKGKVSYMSPEQLRCEPLDRRSDIFSLGVVLYQVVTGQKPFQGATDVERLNKIMRYDFEKPSNLVPDLDPHLEGIILNAMAQFPDERYATATAMAADLEGYIRSTGQLAEPEHLSRIMHELFEAEYTYHFEKVKEVRKSDSAAPEKLPLSSQNIKKTAPSLPRNIQLNRELPLRKERKRPLPTAGWLVLLCIIVGGGALLVSPYLSSNKKKENRRPAQSVDVSSKDGHEERASNVEIETHRRKSASLRSKRIKNASTIEINLKIRPKNAAVELNGVSMGKGIDDLKLPADGAEHRLRISAKGFKDQTETIIADRDKRISVSLTPKKAGKKRRIRKKALKTLQRKQNSVLETSPYQ